MQLLEERVLIKPYPESEKTKGGIIIPEICKSRPKIGKVIIVGNGHTIMEGNLAGQKVPMTVKVNDEVIYDSDAGEDMEYEGEKTVMLLENSIKAII